MSNYRRAYVSGGTYFFTVVTYRRQHLFHYEMARHSLNRAIAKTRQNYPFSQVGWATSFVAHLLIIMMVGKKNTFPTLQLNLNFKNNYFNIWTPLYKVGQRQPPHANQDD